MNENKRLIKNTGIIAVGNISTKLISFLLLPLYTTLLSTAEYGTFDYIISIATFCVPFVSVLMDESIFRFLIDCKSNGSKKKVISTSMLIVFLGMIGFIVIGLPIMQILKYKYTYYVIFYILLNVMSGMISALLRGIGRTDQYALFNFLLGTIQILLNVIFIAGFKMGLIGMISASILAQFIISVFFISRMRLWRYMSFRMFDSKLAKEMIIYSFPLIPNKISWTIINLSDRIVLMNVLGSSATGLYAVSYKFPNLMDTIYGFFYQSWKESSARILTEDIKTQNIFYNRIYIYLKNFMYSIVLGMIAFMPLIFKILINSRYYDALFYIPFLLIGTYFSNISGFYGGVFTAFKDTKIMGTTTMVAAILNLIINLLLIQKLGIYAAAFSTLLANFAVYVYRKNKVKKYIFLEENKKMSLNAIIITTIILLLFYSENTLYIIFSCVIAFGYAYVANKKLIKYLLLHIKTCFLYRGRKND